MLSLSLSGRDALETMRRLESLTGAPTPANGATYPDDDFGRRLAELARLVRARVGVRVACVDLDGWDTHFVEDETLEERARVLGLGLSEFFCDLGRDGRDVTVIVVTEFGRRVRQNVSLGTDHGRGSVLFALGAGVRGGRVAGDFPGLRPDDLEEPGDLRVTTDHRSVLAEWARARAGVTGEALFGSASLSDVGVFEPV